MSRIEENPASTTIPTPLRQFGTDATKADGPPRTDAHAEAPAKFDVAILIVTYNSEAEICRCLQSVFAGSSSVSRQVIVVDNASSDGTVKAVREQFPAVRLIEPGKNLGFAAGVNLAASYAAAAHLLLLNPDTVLLDNAVEVIVEFALDWPRHGLYGGRIVNEQGETDPMSCWGQPTLWSMACFALGLSTLFSRNAFFDPESLGPWQRNTVCTVGVISGCFLLAETELWRKLGGFDERYFMYGEDADLARRAIAMGHYPLLCPNACLLHEWGRSSGTPVHKALLLFRGKASLVRAHWQGAARHIALLFLVTGVGLRYLLTMPFSAGRSGAHERWSALWRARWEWIRGYDV